MRRLFASCIAGLIAWGSLNAAAAAESRILCVFDPSGANGDAFNIAKDYRAAALDWGVAFTLKPYTDERTAVEDFKAERCHAVLLTGVRARELSRFASTVEALGAMSNYDDLGRVIHSLAGAQAARLMTQGPYETVGIFPAGAVYLYLRNRGLTTVDALAGQRIATIDFDPAARSMVTQVGASLVTADIGTFAPMFNNGAVDACYAPAVAHVPLELHKGLGDKGGIVRLPLSQLTFQILTRQSAFPADFGQSSRSFAATQLPRLFNMVQNAEAKIPAKLWIDVPDRDRQSYDDMFQNVRLRLRDEQAVYDKTMLTLMRRVRCKSAPSRAECAENLE